MATKRRGKVELKRIENKSSRQVSFSKRRNGLFKKARELSVLCDAEIAVSVISDGGRFYEFSAGNNRRHADPRNNAQQHSPAAKIFLPESSSDPSERNSLLHPAHGFLDRQIIEQLNTSDLVQLETQLSATLIQTREIKEKRLMEEVRQQQHPQEIGGVSHEEEKMTEMRLGLGKNEYQKEEGSYVVRQ